MAKALQSHPRRGLEIRRLTPADEAPLARFFEAIHAAGDDRFFHPHPFTPEEARRLATATGDDLYYILTDGAEMLAYGMLRGWDAGYEVPSLGIAVHPAARGQGWGHFLMHFLHAAARARGAKRIRLKVYPENQVARQMYERFGYRFTGEEQGHLVGWLELDE